jgi:hypothetical protein
MSAKKKLTVSFGNLVSEHPVKNDANAVPPLLQLYETEGQKLRISPPPSEGLNIVRNAVAALPNSCGKYCYAANGRRMPSKNFKTVYANFAKALDKLEPDQRDLFLTKLALLLAKEVNDVDIVCDLIDISALDLEDHQA